MVTVSGRDVIIFVLVSVLLYLYIDKLSGSYYSTGNFIERSTVRVPVSVSVQKHDCPSEGFNSYMKSMINLPEWYRNNDWGLTENPGVKNDIKYYAPEGHDGEEETAWQNFFFKTTKGLMLEMGALDGKERSVSLLYERARNWRSILIEANPVLVPRLAVNRPNALKFHSAICDSARMVHFITHETREEVNGILEFMSPGFHKTIFPELLRPNGSLDWKKIGKDSRVKEIPCVPLMSVLLPLGITHINFFLLDVENAELSVLQAIDFDKIKFDVISIETERFVDEASARDKYIDSILSLLTTKGYLVWNRLIGPNTWVVHPDFVPFKQQVSSPITF